MAFKPTLEPNGFLPISIYQNMLMTLAENPETRPEFHQYQTLRWAFRIKPGVPQRTLRRAFSKLVARHDSLRLHFVKAGDEWQAKILAEHPQGLLVEDLSHLPEDAQNAAILERGTRPISPLFGPLFEMVLLKCGKAGDVVLIRAYHSIIDGYSAVLLIEDLLKIILNMPLLGKSVGHADFMTRRQQNLRERVEEKERFWKERLLPIPDDLNIGRRKKGLPPFSPQAVSESIRLDDILTPEQSDMLEKSAKSAGVSSFSCLHAAFSETICKMGRQNEVLMTSFLGRQDAAMMGFVGADVHGLLVKYIANPHNIMERAVWVANQIAEAANYVPSKIFSPDQDIAKAIAKKGISRSRFYVHIREPSGRLANSPFKKLFSKGLAGKVTLGLVSLERIDLPGQLDTDFELGLLVYQAKNGFNAALVADIAAFSKDELAEIADGIRHQLGFDQD
jgi:hypothetical protein